MKRELLCDVSMPQPRVWASVYDSPPGTLVQPSRGSNLYVTTQGMGWWLPGDRTNPEWIDGEIAYVEASGNGWPLGLDAAGCAPFREVFR